MKNFSSIYSQMEEIFTPLCRCERTSRDSSVLSPLAGERQRGGSGEHRASGFPLPDPPPHPPSPCGLRRTRAGEEKRQHVTARRRSSIRNSDDDHRPSVPQRRRAEHPGIRPHQTGDRAAATCSARVQQPGFPDRDACGRGGRRVLAPRRPASSRRCPRTRRRRTRAIWPHGIGRARIARPLRRPRSSWPTSNLT